LAIVDIHTTIVAGILLLKRILPTQIGKACEITISGAKQQAVLDGQGRQVSVRNQVRLHAGFSEK
jgi:hypothetical protein